eukprot:6601232-Pyramimonas_sp.AAC.1
MAPHRPLQSVEGGAASPRASVFATVLPVTQAGGAHTAETEGRSPLAGRLACLTALHVVLLTRAQTERSSGQNRKFGENLEAFSRKIEKSKKNGNHLKRSELFPNVRIFSECPFTCQWWLFERPSFG